MFEVMVKNMTNERTNRHASVLGVDGVDTYNLSKTVYGTDIYF